MRFKLTHKKVTIAGAQVAIKNPSPAMQDDIFALIADIQSGLSVIELIKNKLQDGTLKRLLIALTDLSDEEYDETPFQVLIELAIEVFNENADVFTKALSKLTAKQPTGQE